MKTKALYLIVNDAGDGSYHICYTMDKAWIDEQLEHYENGDLVAGDPGVDGDGFHYSTIQVPVDFTYETLGIDMWAVAGYEP